MTTSENTVKIEEENIGIKRKNETEDDTQTNKKNCTEIAEHEHTPENAPKEEKPILFNGQDINNLSKSQMKKYKKMLSWQATKKEKRMKEKLKAKQRKIEARKQNIDLGPSRKQLKQSKMSESPCKIGVVIDLDFDELMIPKVSFMLIICIR